MGARKAPTGTPAAARRLIAMSRCAGAAVRGSIARRSSSSRLVAEMNTCTSERSAKRTKRSRSRRTRAFLVTIDKRIAMVEQHFEAAARQLEAPLRRLIAVGDARERDGVAAPPGLGEGGAEQRRRLVLDHDARLEVQPGAKAQSLMRRPRIAIRTTVLTTAIGVEAIGETEIRAVVARQDRLGVIGEKGGRDAAFRLVLGLLLPAVASRQRFALGRGEAVRWIAAGTALQGTASSISDCVQRARRTCATQPKRCVGHRRATPKS